MQTTEQRLLELYERDGKLTAESVLEDGTDPDSPLHSQFEWDDQIAAFQFRLEQARAIVRRAHVTILERPARRFVFVTSTDSYHPIETAMSRVEWRVELLDEFERDAARFHAKWVNHKHIADHYRKWRNKPI